MKNQPHVFLPLLLSVSLEFFCVLAYYLSRFRVVDEREIEVRVERGLVIFPRRLNFHVEMPIKKIKSISSRF